MVDVAPGLWGNTAGRLQYVDFSYFVASDHITIAAAKTTKPTRIIEGAFDNQSFGCIGAAILSFALVVWLMERRRKSNVSLVDALMLTVSSLLRNDHFHSNKTKKFFKSSKYFLTFAGLTLFFISSMYCSVIISVLSTQKKVMEIESLDDLVTKLPNMKILTIENNLGHITLRKSPLYEKLLPRLELITPQKMNRERDAHFKLYEKVHDGSHVLVDWRSNIDFHYNFDLNPDAKCALPKKNLGFSTNPLTGTMFSSWAYRKHFPYRNLIDSVSLLAIRIPVYKL